MRELQHYLTVQICVQQSRPLEFGWLGVYILWTSSAEAADCFKNFGVGPFLLEFMAEHAASNVQSDHPSVEVRLGNIEATLRQVFDFTLRQVSDFSVECDRKTRSETRCDLGIQPKAREKWEVAQI